MNKIDLLKTRRAKLLEAGKDIRADISALTDDGSFVELDAYAFSHSDFLIGSEIYLDYYYPFEEIRQKNAESHLTKSVKNGMIAIWKTKRS